MVERARERATARGGASGREEARKSEQYKGGTYVPGLMMRSGASGGSWSGGGAGRGASLPAYDAARAFKPPRKQSAELPEVEEAVDNMSISSGGSVSMGSLHSSSSGGSVRMGSIHSSSSGGTTSSVSSMRSADGTLVISMRSADGTLEERFVPPAGSTRVDASRGGQPLGPPSFTLNPNAAEFVPGVEYNYDERQRYAGAPPPRDVFNYDERQRPGEPGDQIQALPTMNSPDAVTPVADPRVQKFSPARPMPCKRPAHDASDCARPSRTANGDTANDSDVKSSTLRVSACTSRGLPAAAPHSFEPR